MGQASDEKSLGGWHKMLGQGRPELSIIVEQFLSFRPGGKLQFGRI
jgi:hypothetical protein